MRRGAGTRLYRAYPQPGIGEDRKRANSWLSCTKVGGRANTLLAQSVTPPACSLGKENPELSGVSAVGLCSVALRQSLGFRISS